MNKFKVKVLPENLSTEVPEGARILDAVRRVGIDVSSPCGGKGTCGKCAVRLIDGKVEKQSQDKLPEELRKKGFVLSCGTVVKGDVTIEVPAFSRLTKHSVMMEGKGAAIVPGKPLAQKIHLVLEKPDLSNSMNDLDRLMTALSTQHGIKEAGITLRALRKLPGLLRDGGFEVTVFLTCIRDKYEIVDMRPGSFQAPFYGLAVDIGTTTVAAALVDLETGAVAGRAGSYNKQAAYGSDVISRIIYADENENGLKNLQDAVVETINELAGQMFRENGVNSEDICVMTCAGNTVMSHLFAGLSPKYLRLEPYVPAAVRFPVLRAKELGIEINPEAHIVVLPSVASYVGGDITAGLMAVDIAKAEELTLFIDIGTNGELVLGNRDWLVACSCSAGPAFEGSGITNGMRAMDGAIDYISIDRDTYEVEARTIGNKRALGICGSGLIYSISEMVKAGIMDKAGRFSGSIRSGRMRNGAESPEFVLVYASESGTGNDIVITEADVKNLIRAKAAIFAGIMTMLHQMQLKIDDIKKIYVAGGFGRHLNISDSISIGMLPDLPEDKFEYVGNTSLQGALMALLDQDAINKAENIADMTTYLELSLGNTFMEEFVSALFIPHTDLSLFSRSQKLPDS